MTRDLRICHSVRRGDVERLRVIGGLPERKIATNYGFRYGDVLRHFREHVAPARDTHPK
jgi:hypothetical protein